MMVTADLLYRYRFPLHVQHFDPIDQPMHPAHPGGAGARGTYRVPQHVSLRIEINSFVVHRCHGSYVSYLFLIFFLSAFLR